MKIFTVTGREVQLTSGILELNEDQFRRRSHKLKRLDNGMFEIVEPVTFKQGEVIGYDGQLSKAHAELLVDADEPEKKSKKAK